MLEGQRSPPHSPTGELVQGLSSALAGLTASISEPLRKAEEYRKAEILRTRIGSFLGSDHDLVPWLRAFESGCRAEGIEPVDHYSKFLGPMPWKIIERLTVAQSTDWSVVKDGAKTTCLA